MRVTAFTGLLLASVGCIGIPERLSLDGGDGDGDDDGGTATLVSAFQTCASGDLVVFSVPPRPEQVQAVAWSSSDRHGLNYISPVGAMSYVCYVPSFGTDDGEQPLQNCVSVPALNTSVLEKHAGLVYGVAGECQGQDDLFSLDDNGNLTCTAGDVGDLSTVEGLAVGALRPASGMAPSVSIVVQQGGSSEVVQLSNGSSTMAAIDPAGSAEVVSGLGFTPLGDGSDALYLVRQSRMTVCPTRNDCETIDVSGLTANGGETLAAALGPQGATGGSYRLGLSLGFESRIRVTTVDSEPLELGSTRSHLGLAEVGNLRAKQMHWGAFGRCGASGPTADPTADDADDLLVVVDSEVGRKLVLFFDVDDGAECALVFDIDMPLPIMEVAGTEVWLFDRGGSGYLQLAPFACDPPPA